METVVGRRAHVVGCSDGGIVALLVDLRRPELVDRLVLIARVFHFNGWLPEVIDPNNEPPGFLARLSAGVARAAQAYIVGHEFGHHVQQLIGIVGTVADANKLDPSGQNARSVQVELQADCLAGVWGRSAYPRSELNIGDLNGALKAADVIGDDYLQQASGDIVDSTLWTHGSSQQRQYWLRTGYHAGDPAPVTRSPAGKPPSAR
jgi:pimeloyl-ACP methyl ester carboxylesterase